MKPARIALFIVVLLALAVWILLPKIDSYNPGGSARIAGLSGPVRIVRDENGVPYIFAHTFEDAIAGQGFVTAQDRLFQLQMMRMLSQGRLSELVGEPGLAMDTMVHLIDVAAQANRQTNILIEEDRAMLQSYVNGVNAYLVQRTDEISLPLRRNPPQPWTLKELVTLQIFNSWGSTVNWRQELLSQSLIDHLGVERAAEISQLTINADDEAMARASSNYAYQAAPLGITAKLADALPAADASGSNSWVTGSSRSAGGLPIVASDPHIDARRLPGFWHPVGLITPEWRAVGGAAAGGAGIGIGRTNFIVWGVTNGYGDMVDVFVEQEDPANSNHYLEGSKSIPFETRQVQIKIKDASAKNGFRSHTLNIRSTRRGPIVSDHGFPVASGKLLSLRWAVPEYFNEVLTTRRLMLAKTTAEALAAIGHVATPLTFIVADLHGNIARTGAGFIPQRKKGDGAAPILVNGTGDAWGARIPPAEMPQVQNPKSDWLATANHRILPADYAYHYSTFFAHSWRYRRILERMNAQDVWTTADHWALQLDNKNMFAEQLAPLMAAVLMEDEATRAAAEILQAWDYRDDADQAAPLIFQSLLRYYARAVVQDELGEALAAQYLKDYYYWHERIFKITIERNALWIDDINTEKKETREDLFRRAGASMLAELVPQYGPDPADWRWGGAHTITFSHPLLRGDLAAKWIGGGTHGISGSGETLNRAAYQYAAPYRTTFFASMRMVMDLSDPDKIEAHISGGVSERLFNSQMTNSLPSWISGTPNYWWFSDAAIAEHQVSELLISNQ
ncbi:MAG: penicillin acylase family protein [Pseudomonadales bacterium]|nr:penicillin acylase family protein [Pseudomonadales bacterium]